MAPSRGFAMFDFQTHLSCQIPTIGFKMNEKGLRRAGLDYIDWSIVYHYNNYDDYIEKNGSDCLYAISTKGKRYYSDCNFTENDSFIFGPETRGLPKKILEKFATNDALLFGSETSGLPKNIKDEFARSHQLYLPMQNESRSLNLSNSVAICLYEAWRQIDFKKIY